MRRREFAALACGTALVWAVCAFAQQARQVRTLSVLMGPARSAQNVAGYNAFLQRLSSLGWIEGGNLRVEIRWANSEPGLMQDYAKELVGLAPDVMLVQSNSALAALRPVAADLPIVFVHVAEPVNSGFISSLAHPGGNITGFTNFEASMGSKWLQMLQEIAPNVTHVTILMHPETAAHSAMAREAQSAAPRLGLAASVAGIHDAHDVDGAIAAVSARPNGGIIVLPHAVTELHLNLILALTRKYGLPSIHPFRAHAEAGGLIAYGIDAPELVRRAADYVDRILRGAKPAELPVQAADKFDLVINLRTAKSLGLTVPPSLLARADEVIE
jgi:ABC-type uncharacterized transport system substrate-binding protein